MLRLEENNEDYRGLLDWFTDNDLIKDNDFGYYYTEWTIGYKVSFKTNELVGQLCHFTYGHHNFFGKILKQNPIQQTLTIEAYSHSRYLEEVSRLKESFDYVI